MQNKLIQNLKQQDKKKISLWFCSRAPKPHGKTQNRCKKLLYKVGVFVFLFKLLRWATHQLKPAKPELETGTWVPITNGFLENRRSKN